MSRRSLTLIAVLGAIILVLVGVAALLLLNRPTQATGEGRPPVSEEAEAPPSEPETAGPTSTPDQTPPAPPSGIWADHVAVYDILVGWQDNSDNEDGFNIYRKRADMAEGIVHAGTVGANVTEFVDGDVWCGGTYQYIIASFNEAGESPATTCWQITLPPCPPTLEAELTTGAENSYNFLLGERSPNSDFYLGLTPEGTARLMADQEGQQGLFELGPADDTPLFRITMPADPVYVRDGLPLKAGNRYVARARNGVSLIIFDVTGVGNAVTLSYTVWNPGDVIESGPCERVGVPGYTPGGPCITGDDLCDPLCVEPDEDQINRTVEEEEPDCEDCWLEEETYGYMVEEDCFYCQSESEEDRTLTYTATDEDCGDVPCIPGDDICNPFCEDFTQNECDFIADFGSVSYCCVFFEDGSGKECYPLTDPDCEEDQTPPPPACVCGDGICNPECENTDLCPQDCPCVDDGTCTPGEGLQCRDCGETAGGCGNPCTDSSQCQSGLSCFGGVCWDACTCGGDCGGEECPCSQVCTAWNTASYPPACVRWEWRDCHGAPCTP